VCRQFLATDSMRPEADQVKGLIEESSKVLNLEGGQHARRELGAC
jgi:hypothetical protein